MNKPVHLVARFAEKDHFLQSYMYHVPSGGLFIDLGESTPEGILQQDRKTLIGQTAEVRIIIKKPEIEIGFRGAITFASPFKKDVLHRRIGVEFFRYEFTQKNFLLDLLSKPEPKEPKESNISRRRHRRYPMNFRIQFKYEKENKRPNTPRISITGKTEEISISGCSFNSVRFLEPGSSIKVKLYPSEGEAMELSSIVRWNDEKNFNHRLMGLEFNYDDPQTKAFRPKLEQMLTQVQTQMETELIERRHVSTELQA